MPTAETSVTILNITGDIATSQRPARVNMESVERKITNVNVKQKTIDSEVLSAGTSVNITKKKSAHTEVQMLSEREEEWVYAD